MDKLNIKVHNLYRIEGDQPLKAFVDININDVLLIKGLKVLEGKQSGLFVSYPMEQAKDKKWYEQVKPLDRSTQDQIAEVILKEYNNA
jgi:DNA-binding cell septation regulator SpoVG